MNLAWVQQADPISSFQKRVVEVLSLTRSGFQPDDDLLRSDLQWPQMGKEPLKACCIVAELTGFDHSRVSPSSGNTSYTTPCQYRYLPHTPVRLGEVSERTFQTLFLPSLLTHKREGLPIASTGHPSNQDERALIVDRQSCQFAPAAATSLIVAFHPDGRGAVCRRWSRSLQRGHTLQPRLSRCFHQSSTPVPFGGEVCYLPNSI